MTRAVIELAGDISPVMSRMSKLIEGCAYNPETRIMAFRFKDIGVIVERNKIFINNAEDEAIVQTVIDWLKSILVTVKETVVKREVN